MSDLVIDALTVLGAASATLVNIELTDGRGDPIVGYVDGTDQVIVLPTTVTTDENGQVTVDVIPTAAIVPGNSCYTVRIGPKQFLIQKSGATQNLFEALVEDPGDLDPIGTDFLLAANNLSDVDNAATARFNLAITADNVPSTPFGGIEADSVQEALEEIYLEAAGGTSDHQALLNRDVFPAHPASVVEVTPFATITATDVQEGLEQVYAAAVSGLDEASEISFVPTGDLSSLNVQDAIVEVDTEFHAHLTDAVDAHDASAISFAPADTIIATNAQDAIVEALTDARAYTDAHIADTSDAHMAANLGIATYTNGPVDLSSTTVQNQIREVADESVPRDGSYAAAGTDVVASRVVGNANARFSIDADGTIRWGPGATALDTILYRNSTNGLKTDDKFTAAEGIFLPAQTAVDPVNAPILNFNGTNFSGASVNNASIIGGATGAVFDFTSGSANPVLFWLRAIPVLSGTVGGTLSCFRTDTRATNTGTWAGFGELNGNLVGTDAFARTVSPFSATGDSACSIIGVKGQAGHGAGAGTVGQIMAFVAASPTYTAGGTVTNGAQGVRVGNQGNSGYGTAYGVRIDGQTGSSSLNVGARIDVATQRTLWLAGDSNPTTAAGGITFGSSADTNLYRSAANILTTDDKFTAVAGLGVGNSAVATTSVGSLAHKIEVFDAAGASLGFIPVYSTIT